MKPFRIHELIAAGLLSLFTGGLAAGALRPLVSFQG
jgi:hypothetical protein